MAQIFISYRRNDTAYFAATLSDKLQQRFGPSSVFFDVDNIPLGVDFREHMGNAVGQCDVLLAIIGDQWMGIDSHGKRRIDDPHDHVRVEIEAALKRDIPVIPVLVEAAKMPSETDLPPAIKGIVFRNAAEVRAGRDLRQHIEQLIHGLEALVRLSDCDIKPPDDEQHGSTEVETTPLEKPSPPQGTSRGNSIPFEERMVARVDGVNGKTAKQHGHYSALLKEIQNALNGYVNSHLYLGEAIPPDKLANAINSYAPRVAPEEVLFFYDNTLWGGAKYGVILTNDAVYWCNVYGNPTQLFFKDIENLEITECKSVFTSPKIFINQEVIEIVNAKVAILPSTGIAETNKLTEALANVIRRIVKRLKSTES